MHERTKSHQIFNSSSPSSTALETVIASATQLKKDLLNKIVTIKFQHGQNVKNECDSVSDGPSLHAELTLQAHSNSEIDKVRAVTQKALDNIGETDQPLLLMDLDKVLAQYTRWKNCLPNIQPCYAVKCNPDPVLVAYLQSLGCDFDCATASEMDLVVNRLGHQGNRVVFSNPCKLESHIRFAKQVGVQTTIIDNMDEILKIKNNFSSAKVLIRLACSDSSARSPMSMKFGATRDQVRPLLALAAEVGLECVGIHFHVGSGCSDPNSYSKALVDARRAFDIGTEYGHNMHIVDIGGGFPNLDSETMVCKASNGVHFEEMALVINSLLDQLFPNDPLADGTKPYRFLAEPGRFFAGGCVSLVNKVHSKSVVGITTEPEGSSRKLIRYYMTEGLYGTLSCVLFDQQDKLKPYLLNDNSFDDTMSQASTIGSSAVAYPKATMFGPTCDGFDKIGETEDLPELFVGDRIIYLNFGAYTMSITTGFNGFEPGKLFYYKSQ